VGIADLALADVVVEIAGAGGEGNLYFVEAAVEGRRRCSGGTAVGVEERSGHSSAERNQATTEGEGSLVTVVEEGSQATLAEAAERLLLCKLGASRHRPYEEHTVPAIGGGCSKRQCILPVQRDS
jgi:CDGSH-type Zn-finger protein